MPARSFRFVPVSLALFAAFSGPGMSRVARPEEPAKPETTVAIGGYCPVSYQTESKAVKGDPAHAVQHQGWSYHCATADAKKLFEKEPAKYVPQYGGLCTTALGGSYGNRLPSDPAVFYVLDGKLYLFSSLRARNAFDRSPPQYIAKADKLFSTPAAFGYSTTAYQLQNKPVKGDPRFTRYYHGLPYHFDSEESAAAFEKAPGRFIPRYGGYCAEAVSRGNRYPGDPKIFAVVDERTYLFFDEEARKKFEAAAREMIAQADADWTKSPGVPGTDAGIPARISTRH